MVAIRAIPRSMLPHTVTLIKETPKKDDFWGDEVNQGEETLRYVRIEQSSKIVRDKNNAEVQLAATLFYDCKNSIPRNIQFVEDDVIVFNGLRHKVQVSELLYDEKKPHHYELELIKRA